MTEAGIMAEFDEGLSVIATIPGLAVIGHSDQPYSPREDGEWWINVDFEHSALGFEAMRQLVSAIQSPPPGFEALDDVSFYVWEDARLRFTVHGDAGSSPSVLAKNVVGTLQRWEGGW